MSRGGGSMSIGGSVSGIGSAERDCVCRARSAEEAVVVALLGPEVLGRRTRETGVDEVPLNVVVRGDVLRKGGDACDDEEDVAEACVEEASRAELGAVRLMAGAENGEGNTPCIRRSVAVPLGRVDYSTARAQRVSKRTTSPPPPPPPPPRNGPDLRVILKGNVRSGAWRSHRARRRSTGSSPSPPWPRIPCASSALPYPPPQRSGELHDTRETMCRGGNVHSMANALSLLAVMFSLMRQVCSMYSSSGLSS
jgi:hypothetical protein